MCWNIYVGLWEFIAYGISRLFIIGFNIDTFSILDFRFRPIKSFFYDFFRDL